MKLNYFFKKCQNGIESFNWIFVYFVYFFSVFVRSFANLPRCQKNGLAPTILLRLFFLFIFFLKNSLPNLKNSAQSKFNFCFRFSFSTFNLDSWWLLPSSFLSFCFIIKLIKWLIRSILLFDTTWKWRPLRISKH